MSSCNIRSTKEYVQSVYVVLYNATYAVSMQYEEYKKFLYNL